jgi:death-on-curing protein
MKELPPKFLTRPQIERLHDMSLAKFGGSAGVRDSGLVDSALASASNTFFYGTADLFDIAAAYAFHLAQAQAFIDGNKRTGMGAALTFAENNGIRVTTSEDALYDAMIALADKTMTKSGLAGLFRDGATKI